MFYISLCSQYCGDGTWHRIGDVEMNKVHNMIPLYIS